MRRRTTDAAIAKAIIRNLKRYDEDRDGSFWHDAGPFVPQKLIPMATKSEARKAERVMQGRYAQRIMWVDPRRLISSQRRLRLESLLWNLRSFDRMQRELRRAGASVDERGQNLPCVVFVDGTGLVWNGNHRTTVGILLNRERILVKAVKAWPSPARARKGKAVRLGLQRRP